MDLAIQFNAEPAVAMLQQYPARVRRATVRSLNRALTSGRATLARLISKDMGLKVGDAKEKIRVQQADKNRLYVRLAASLKRIPLIDFNAKGPYPSRGRGRGVSYRIGTGGRGRVENAFIAQTASGHRGVFKRTTKKRLPIIELFGPSIGRVFTKHQGAGIAQMRETFDKNFARELEFTKSEGAGA